MRTGKLQAGRATPRSSCRQRNPMRCCNAEDDLELSARRQLVECTYQSREPSAPANVVQIRKSLSELIAPEASRSLEVLADDHASPLGMYFPMTHL